MRFACRPPVATGATCGSLADRAAPPAASTTRAYLREAYTGSPLLSMLGEHVAAFHAGVVPSGTWRTKDGKYVVVGGNGDSIYSRLMAAVGRQDMAADNPDYADNSRRCEREDEINEVLCIQSNAYGSGLGHP